MTLYRHIKKYVQVDDLVFDLSLMIIFGYIYFFVQKGQSLVESINPWVMMIFLGFIILLVPWYMAVIYRQYSDNREKIPGGKFTVALAGLLSFTSAVAICAGTPIALTYYDYNEWMGAFLAFLLLAGFAAILGGWFSGLKYRENIDDPEKASEGVSTFITVVFGIFGPFAAIFGFIWTMMEGFGPVTIVAIVALVGPLLFGGDAMKTAFSPSIVRHIIFPFIICFSLVFAHEVLFDLLMKTASQRTAGSTIMLLTVTGLIPTRLILLFAPPFKPINFIMGQVSIGFILLDVFY